jgi:hypothetical protein
MKYLSLTLLIFVTSACNNNGQRAENNDSSIREDQNQWTTNPEDSMAIVSIVDLLQQRGKFEEREKIWAEDGRWLQSFGRVFYGRDTIIAFNKMLETYPGYENSYIGRMDEPEIKFIRPDVVVVHQYKEREGQTASNIGTRKINQTYIFTKEDGNWLLRDLVTMDEKQPPKKSTE